MVTLKLPDNAAMRALRDWRTLLRTARPTGPTVLLDRRHIYILPTRQGVLFALVLVCMLVGSINYALSLGFVLTFLLAGLGVIAMLHTWRNLANLTVIAGKTPPVFAGGEAAFMLIAADRQGRARQGIGFGYRDDASVYVDVPADSQREFAIPLAAARRGWLAPGRLTVHTEFPLGLFHAWSYVDMGQRCLVYPQPAAAGLPPAMAGTEGSAGSHAAASGDDDFAGLRHYQFGDSPRRIDWKALAREQGLFTKQFQGATHALLWLDWSSTGGDTEARIAQLTRWVLDANASSETYGLRLPGLEIAPASGEAHFRQCMESLALFEAPQ